MYKYVAHCVYVYFIQNPQINVCQKEMHQAVKQEVIYLMMPDGYMKAQKFLLMHAYRIIHESSPIQQEEFSLLIPYDADGNIISPIAKLELNTPREQSSDGLFIRGTSYILLSPPAVVRKLIFPSPLHQNNEGESKTKKIACK